MSRLCDPGPRQQVWPGVFSVCSLAPCPRPPRSFRPRLLPAPCSVSFTEAQRRAHQLHRAVCVQGLLTRQRGLSVLARVHHHVLSSDLGTHCPCVVIAPDSAAHHGHRLSAPQCASVPAEASRVKYMSALEHSNHGRLDVAVVNCMSGMAWFRLSREEKIGYKEKQYRVEACGSYTC